MSLLSEEPVKSTDFSVADTEFRKARGVSMLQSIFPFWQYQSKQVVRPPGFEPGTRGWKPLVITPSLQARGPDELIASLNRFGWLKNLKASAYSIEYASKKKSWRNYNYFISSNKWPFVEDADGFNGSSHTHGGISISSILTTNVRNWDTNGFRSKSQIRHL